MNFPMGTVTFLFTDLEGSTRLWEQYPEAMQAVLARHDDLLRAAVENHQGIVVKTTGDGLHAVFAAASEGAAAAVAAQGMLASETWPQTFPLKVRMALHTGEGQLREGDYYGTSPNRAARLMDSGHGGQILLSQSTAALLRDHLPPGSRLVDLGEHVLRDLVRPERIFQLAYPGAPDKFPPLKTLASYPNNLPLQLNSFIGRTKEMAEVKDLLAQTRLLTLTGIGGTGKTRLMLQVAAEELHNFSSGVWLVELAAVPDPDQVAGQIAKTLGVQEQPNRPLLESLGNYLRLKNLLLLLDNCEHLLEACASAAQQLLQTCPGLKVLATSREGLAIAGEIALQVPSLSLPEINEPASPERLAGSEAAQLFLERGRASAPTFRLTPANASAIAQICRRLDGIPLAIELAAARVRALPVEAIADRLDDRFRLLTGGSRTALPRQQTLQALIDWSWNLLSEPEQRILRQLSAFAGGWTLEAAEAVVGDPDKPQGSSGDLDILDGLAQLVDKSLVVVEEQVDGSVRYSLLETLRQYARIKLVEAGGTHQIRDHHSQYYIDQVIQAEPALMGPDMLASLQGLRKESGNLQAAMAWSLENHIKLALRLAGSLMFVLFSRGMIGNSTEFRSWLENLIPKSKDLPIQSKDGIDPLEVDRVRAHSALAQIYTMRGDYEKGCLIAEQAVALARDQGDPGTLAYTLSINALVVALAGEIESSIILADEAILLARQRESDWFYGWTLATAIPNFGFGGDPRTGSLTKEIDRVAAKTGNPLLIAHARFGQSHFALSQGETVQALSLFKETLARFTEIGDRQFMTMTRSEIAHILRRTGKSQEALSIYFESILAWQELGHQAAVAHQLECFAYLTLEVGEDARAVTLLGAAAHLRESTNAPRRGSEQAEYDAAVQTLRTRLDTSAFEEAFGFGRRMAMEAAIKFALGQ